MEELSHLFYSGAVNLDLMPAFNYSDPSSVALEEYRTWFKQHGKTISEKNLTDCNLEQEMQKVKSGFL